MKWGFYMATQSGISEKSFFHTEFVRQPIQSDLLEGIVNILQSLKNRMVEMILLPLDRDEMSCVNRQKEYFSLEKFAGAWAGESLVREDEGSYEVREELE